MAEEVFTRRAMKRARLEREEETTGKQSVSSNEGTSAFPGRSRAAKASASKISIKLETPAALRAKKFQQNVNTAKTQLVNSYTTRLRNFKALKKNEPVVDSPLSPDPAMESEFSMEEVSETTPPLPNEELPSLPELPSMPEPEHGVSQQQMDVGSPQQKSDSAGMKTCPFGMGMSSAQAGSSLQMLGSYDSPSPPPPPQDQSPQKEPQKESQETGMSETTLDQISEDLQEKPTGTSHEEATEDCAPGVAAPPPTEAQFHADHLPKRAANFDQSIKSSEITEESEIRDEDPPDDDLNDEEYERFGESLDLSDLDSSDDEAPPEPTNTVCTKEKQRIQRRRREKLAALRGGVQFEVHQKVVLKRVGKVDHFEMLPENWIELTHKSGMPVYLNRLTRVCTLAKPYFLGRGSGRNHDIPMSAIPCLYYRKMLEKEQEEQKLQENRENVADSTLGDSDPQKSVAETADGAQTVAAEGGTIAQPGNVSGTVTNLQELANLIPTQTRVENVQDHTKELSIDPMQVRDYCSKLFEFKTIEMKRYKTWADRRRHSQELRKMRRPTLPATTQLITCPLPAAQSGAGADDEQRPRDFVINPTGKSYVCILHEYVQHALRVQPKYIFTELENANTPYGATVKIENMCYGSGFGTSKKAAKSAAAKATLEILIPEMKNIVPDYKPNFKDQDLALFDEVSIEDPRVAELCSKAGQGSPYQILLECTKRHFGMLESQITTEMKQLRNQKSEFTMTVGKYTSTVKCKNKREGKQLAAQKIMQALHPHIQKWGSLLRLYGRGSRKTLREKKIEEQQITELQGKVSSRKPNHYILDKLRAEMLRLRAERVPNKQLCILDIALRLFSGCRI